MINAIVFSYNRAAQLRLLLESIKKNAPGVFNIHILYKASTEDFEKGYNKVQEENIIPGINWHKETSFKEDLLELMKTDFSFSCFFTDDDIIYKPVLESDIITPLMSDPEIFCFSLRLGENTTYCYTMNAPNVLVPLQTYDNYIVWDWTKHYMDFGYPLSVDGHIFRTKDILKMTKKVNYHNPNTFEASLQIFSETSPWFKMTSYKTSALVNSPSNMVQNVFTENRKGETFGISVDELNFKLLEGKVIDFDSISFEGIKGCHQELEFRFKEI